MNNPNETNLNQTRLTLICKENTGEISLSYDVEEDLEKYALIFITKELDMFRLTHCCEAALHDYKRR